MFKTFTKSDLRYSAWNCFLKNEFSKFDKEKIIQLIDSYELLYKILLIPFDIKFRQNKYLYYKNAVEKINNVFYLLKNPGILDICEYYELEDYWIKHVIKHYGLTEIIETINDVEKRYWVKMED